MSLATEPCRRQSCRGALCPDRRPDCQRQAFFNNPASDYFLVRGRPAFYGDAHEFWSDIWQAVGRTADSIRTGVPQAHHDYRRMSKDQQLAFFRGLHSGTKAEAYDLAKRYDFSTHQTVLDVAGGSGGLAIALTERGGCGILYSEDMQDGQQVRNVRIVNPYQ